MSFTVEIRSAGGDATAVGNAGAHTVVVDRPAEAGGRGLGFNGGELLYLAVGGCVSNDLYREARARRITLTEVRIVVRGNFAGDPPVSDEIAYEVTLAGDATPDELRALVADVDAIAEIPNSLRRGTGVRLAGARIGASPVRR